MTPADMESRYVRIRAHCAASIVALQGMVDNSGAEHKKFATAGVAHLDMLVETAKSFATLTSHTIETQVAEIVRVVRPTAVLRMQGDVNQKDLLIGLGRLYALQTLIEGVCALLDTSRKAG